jgi:nucleoid-associated protein YgaU
MKRETRIALLVGLTFIALFGLVLGQRSLKIATACREESAEGYPAAIAPPGPEMVAAAERELPNRPVLSNARQGPQPVGALADADAAHRPPQRLEHLSLPGNLSVGLQEPAPAGEPPPPVGPPALQHPPAPPGLRLYKVQPGDSLIRIARRVYGADNGREYTRIYEANRDRLPTESTLSPGQELVIPPLQGPGRGVPEMASAPSSPQAHHTEMTLEALDRRFSGERTYVVRAGDNLTNIARRSLGSGSRASVRKLYEANRDRIQDRNQLSVGLVLRIPG